MRWHYADDPPKENGWYYVYAPTWRGSTSGRVANVKGCMFSYYRDGKWGAEMNNSDCVEQWTHVPLPSRVDIELIDNVVEEPCKKENEKIISQPVFKVVKKEAKKK